MLQRGQHLDAGAVSRSIDMMNAHESPSKVLTDDILRANKGRSIRPKTAGQKRYIDAIALYRVQSAACEPTIYR